MTVNDLHPPFDGKDKSGDRASLKRGRQFRKEENKKGTDVNRFLFLELIARFELATSSLPRMRSTY